MGHTGLGWALNPVTGVLIRRGRFGRQTYREGDRHLRMKAEIDVSLGQGARTAEPYYNTGRQEKTFSQHSEENGPFDTVISEL